jgi:hypothetical protein
LLKILLWLISDQLDLTGKTEPGEHEYKQVPVELLKENKKWGRIFGTFFAPLLSWCQYSLDKIFDIFYLRKVPGLFSQTFFLQIVTKTML